MPSQRAAAPRSVASAIEAWFREHQRPLPWRETYEPFHVWVSEVMLQQTRMEVVLGYFERFLARFPDVAALVAAPDDDVMAAWSGLGYYRRARMLHDGARDVMQRFAGRVPDTVDNLLTISGIGRYTAGAIASIAYRAHAPIVDGNVARILARLYAIEAPLKSPELMRDSWQRAETLIAAATDPRDFNQGLMELGALVCRPANPRCDACPLRRACAAYAQNRVEELPRKAAKAETRAMRIPLYVIADAAGHVLMRREQGALMNAMFHLPHGDAALLAGTPLRVRNAELLGTFRHTVTNRRIEFEVFRARLARRTDAAGYAWIDPSRMAHVPHPSYVRKALQLVR
jgi:A/G-specific adenine glycosylase